MDNAQKAELMQKSMEKLMGSVIDWARMSQMDERQFNQFARSTKIGFNNTSRFFSQEFFGITKKNENGAEITKE